MSRIKSWEEIIFEKVDKTGSCWIWKGAKDKDGYGKLTRKIQGTREHTYHKAHREAYKISKGDIPKGALICHTCDTPACCNPEHLFLGTPAINTQDMWAKDRHNRIRDKKGRFI